MVKFSIYLKGRFFHNEYVVDTLCEYAKTYVFFFLFFFLLFCFFLNKNKDLPGYPPYLEQCDAPKFHKGKTVFNLIGYFESYVKKKKKKK